MKIKISCDSGANIHSRNEAIVDTVEDLGYGEGEWEALTDDEKHEECMDWAWNSGLEVWHEEVE